jgi:hypothetical protein
MNNRKKGTRMRRLTAAVGAGDLALLGAVALAIPANADTTGGNVPAGPYNLTTTKLQNPTTGGTATNGTQQDVSALTPIPGVQYSIVPVNGIDLTTAAGWTTAATLSVNTSGQIAGARQRPRDPGHLYPDRNQQPTHPRHRGTSHSHPARGSRRRERRPAGPGFPWCALLFATALLAAGGYVWWAGRPAGRPADQPAVTRRSGAAPAPSAAPASGPVLVPVRERTRRSLRAGGMHEVPDV